MTQGMVRNDSNSRSRTAELGSAALPPGPWSVVDVLHQGRTAQLDRRDAQNLVNRAVALAEANAASGGNAEGGPPLLRLQLRGPPGQAVVAQFDLWGSNVFRWRRAGQADIAGSVALEEAAGLLANAARAMPP